MAQISKHYPKEEGEGDAGKDGWVYLLVVGHSVGVDNLLEGIGEVVDLEVGGGNGRFVVHFLQLQDALLARSLAQTAHFVARQPLLVLEQLVQELVLGQVTPHVAIEQVPLSLEFVEALVEALFFLEEEAEDFEEGVHHFLGRIDVHQVLLHLLLRHSDDGEDIVDSLREFLFLSLESLHITMPVPWQLVPFPQERVAHLLDLLSELVGFVVNNHVDALV